MQNRYLEKIAAAVDKNSKAYQAMKAHSEASKAKAEQSRPNPNPPARAEVPQAPGGDLNTSKAKAEYIARKQKEEKIRQHEMGRTPPNAAGTRETAGATKIHPADPSKQVSTVNNAPKNAGGKVEYPGVMARGSGSEVVPHPNVIDGEFKEIPGSLAAKVKELASRINMRHAGLAAGGLALAGGAYEVGKHMGHDKAAEEDRTMLQDVGTGARTGVFLGAGLGAGIAVAQHQDPKNKPSFSTLRKHMAGEMTQATDAMKNIRRNARAGIHEINAERAEDLDEHELYDLAIREHDFKDSVDHGASQYRRGLGRLGDHTRNTIKLNNIARALSTYNKGVFGGLATGAIGGAIYHHNHVKQAAEENPGLGKHVAAGAGLGASALAAYSGVPEVVKYLKKPRELGLDPLEAVPNVAYRLGKPALKGAMLGGANAAALYAMLHHNKQAAEEKFQPVNPAHKGLLHEEMGIAQGEPISEDALRHVIATTDNPHTRRRAQFALNARKWKHR